MTTWQRRRGIEAKVWRVETQTDKRGNVHEVAVSDTPHLVRVWIFAQRSSRAEVAGQQGINVLRIGVDASLDDVSLWSKVELLGRVWDVVAPPTYHHGTRNTRHWSLDIRERPS